MVVRASGINPAMLRWARERAGYSIEEVARRMKVPPERVEGWESGHICPMWKQVERLAHDLYHRSATLFLLDRPPEEPTIFGEFPQLPASALADLHPDTLYGVRQARARQHYLRMLAPAQDASVNHVMLELKNQVDSTAPNSMARSARQRLDDRSDEKAISKTGAASASYWREWVEGAGVWVFLRGFKQEDVAGFCLGEYRFPVIYLNQALPSQRMSASILRQFAHLIFDFNHIERMDENHYLPLLSGDALAAEQACNHFVQELIGVSEGEQGLDPSTTLGTGGGEYYASQATRLGKKYLQAAFLAFEDERIDEVGLSSALGVKTEQLGDLERFAW